MISTNLTFNQWICYRKNLVYKICKYNYKQLLHFSSFEEIFSQFWKLSCLRFVIDSLNNKNLLNTVLNITETEKNSSDYYYGSSHQEILLPAILSGVLLLIFICVSLFIRLRKKYFHNNSSSPSRRTKHDSNSSWCSNCCIGMYQLRILKKSLNIYRLNRVKAALEVWICGC